MPCRLFASELFSREPLLKKQGIIMIKRYKTKNRLENKEHKQWKK